MLMADIILAAIILVPPLLTYFLKSSAALSFLALCAGFVLSTSVVGDLKHLLSQTNLSVTNQTLGLALIITPFLLTILFTRKHSSKGLGLIFQLATALCAGGLLALSIGPLMGSSPSFDITQSQFWTDLNKIQAGLIGAGTILSLLVIWFGGHKPHKKH